MEKEQYELLVHTIQTRCAELNEKADTKLKAGASVMEIRFIEGQVKGLLDAWEIASDIYFGRVKG